MDTRAARRYSGSPHDGVTSTASTSNAAAERISAPTLVWSTMFSMTATRRASRHVSSTLGSGQRRIAESAPRWRRYPVSWRSCSGEATYTGMSVPHRLSTTSKVCDMPSIHGSSTSSEIGSRPAASARSMTLGDSAMNRPRSGSSRLRSWISVRFVYAATRSSSMESMVMNCMGVPRVLMSSYRRRPDYARPSAHTVRIYGKTPCFQGVFAGVRDGT